MKVHEYVGKRILKSYGLKVPKSFLVNGTEDVKKVLEKSESFLEIGFPQVLKAQVLVGGRMKAGGVLFSNSLEETKSYIFKLLNSKIRGQTCTKVLIEEVFEHQQEDYVSIFFDRNEREVYVLYSSAGGIDVEENLENIKKFSLSSIDQLPERVASIVRELIKVFFEKDLTLLEINPIGYRDSEYSILDCVMHLDDSALFRQNWYNHQEHIEISERIIEGNIAVIGCGAGLVMATFDEIVSKGFSVGYFADLGGGATFSETIKILDELPNDINTIIFNIFGGITDTSEVAKAVAEFKKKNKDIKVLIRLTGNNEEYAREILQKCGISFVSSTIELVKALGRDNL